MKISVPEAMDAGTRKVRVSGVAATSSAGSHVASEELASPMISAASALGMRGTVNSSPSCVVPARMAGFGPMAYSMMSPVRGAVSLVPGLPPGFMLRRQLNGLV